MDTSIVSAPSAVVGSIVGLSASVAIGWVAQRTIARRQSLDGEIKKRDGQEATTTEAAKGFRKWLDELYEQVR